MGSLLGYGRQYRWQFRLDSDDFHLAVLRQSRRQQLAIHSGAFSGQHFDSAQSSRRTDRPYSGRKRFGTMQEAQLI
jgi:hypothetical protein